MMRHVHTTYPYLQALSMVSSVGGGKVGGTVGEGVVASGRQEIVRQDYLRRKPTDKV